MAASLDTVAPAITSTSPSASGSVLPMNCCQKASSRMRVPIPSVSAHFSPPNSTRSSVVPSVSTVMLASTGPPKPLDEAEDVSAPSGTSGSTNSCGALAAAAASGSVA